MKKAAVYIRVSTDAQREEGYSIDAQKEMLEAYLVSKGIKSFEHYLDGGFSGSNLDRPEMKRLISDVKSNKISTVIVYKLDRLSRSQKDTLYLIEDVFNPHNVDFISLNESMDTSTPLGRLMLGILSAFAQLERENIRERTRMGMRERVKSGLWMGGGRVPFGYDYDKQKGIIVPNSNAEIVRKMYELYLDGYSTSKIAEIVGLKYEKLAYQILTRKSNCGYIVYNDVEYLGRHESIISLDTYNKAMELMKKRSVSKLQNVNYLLTGLMLCGKCGAKMRYQKWGKAGCKIVCYSQDKNKIHLIKDPNCDNERMWASELEEVIIKDIFSFSLKRKQNAALDNAALSIRDLLEKQYKQTAAKLKKLYNFYAASDDELLLETIEEIKAELFKITVQLKAEKEKENTEISGEIKKKLDTIEEAWEYMTKPERKAIVRAVVNKIIITNGNVEIYYKI